MTDYGVDEFVAQTEQTKEVTRSFEACNSHDLDKMMSFLHSEIVHHSCLSDYPKAGIAFTYQVTLNSFPDLQWKVQEIIAEGNRVAALVLFEGTHQGEYLGKLATGKSCRFFAVDFGVIEYDQVLGMVPAMNDAMWCSSAVRQNVERARGHGYHLIEPSIGLQLVDLKQSPGFMPPLEHILDQLIAIVAAAREAKEAQL